MTPSTSTVESPTAHLAYTADEDDLRSGLRDLLTDRVALPALLARIETTEPYDPKLWRVLAEQIGVTGLAIAEEHGGSGATWRETALVMEELGRAVAPTPFLGSAVLATAALGHCGAHDLLTELAGGHRTATLAVSFATAPGTQPPYDVRADTDDTLTGTVTSVVDAGSADLIVVAATTPQGPTLYTVDPTHEGVHRQSVTSLDLTRPLTDLTLTAAPGRPIARGDAAEAAVAAAITTGAALLASEQLGLAEYCLESTVAYLKTRNQFGRPVGSFQGPKHRLAALWVSITQARAVARYAAACVAVDDPDTAVAVAVAQAHCSDIAVHAAEECVQLHGGIGFTWEHHAHLYLKRAKADALAFGTPDRHRAALAELVDLAP
ncbi:acyl-CoA dehydrogenase family protein [Streptomyces sp. SID3343]|uniref:acyl-CoA dehydrogenase family protein n=1 Tax=Streptomyces sp. SID3343 TaxID=2690260 RepID=UPI0013721351|nr:acyl-CoA dehydrogenase family protein [Streptomyces sp. SID3343]MYV99965.1 acyl-CoA dehydrogenase [Streptomyces sp. SID3343]